MSLHAMIQDPQISIEQIGQFLDALPAKYRLEQLQIIPAKLYKSLYDKAALSMPLTLDFFVPSHLPPTTPVVHHGINTLPLLERFRRFKKIFCRAADGTSRLFGYNENGFVLNRALGPGYFVAYSTRQQFEWHERGAVVIDYFQIPDGALPKGWPPLRPNDKGLQVLIYHETRDFMRRISRHVSIGAAWKREDPLNVYFLLCREEMAGV